MKNPDTDEAAKRLELDLRESNLAVHLDELEEMRRVTQMAVSALPPEPEHNTLAGVASFANAAATVANALGTLINTGLMLEAEQVIVSHARAHYAHEDQEQARQQGVRDAVGESLGTLLNSLRDKGLDAEQIPGFGLMIRRPSDDEPNT